MQLRWIILPVSLALASAEAVSDNPHQELGLHKGQSSSLRGACPCDDAAHCAALPGPPVRQREIFGFDAGKELGIDWERITTIAWAESDRPELLCQAHAAGVRLVARDAIHAPVPITEDVQIRQDWVHKTLQAIEEQFFDGIVFDWESPAAVGSRESQWYAELVNLTSHVFHKRNPSYQISTCVAWSPDNIDGRGYDYPALAQSSDLLYVMDYDTRSQIFDACIAASNAPFPGTIRGVHRFLDIGIPASKLVLGVPWYGYRYPCVRGTAPDARFCMLESVPFRGINCSDAAGTEVPHDEILLRFQRYNTTMLRWDENQGAPFFNTVENGTVFQYWYDNFDSLSAKYTFAKSLGLGGVGPFSFGDISAKRYTQMWRAFDSFRGSAAGQQYESNHNSYN
mmetsp:Transcript_2328/g.3875  ORF Transcript_2328/g.3875 Transcript_2328/m.3875 type:complete len:397 (+) Transcript_2328:25-1215(+)